MINETGGDFDINNNGACSLDTKRDNAEFSRRILAPIPSTSNDSEEVDHTVPNNLLLQVEEEVEVLKKALNRMSMRLGDEIVTDDSGSSLDIEDEVYENPVNTRHYEIDDQFAPKYYFITNVSFEMCTTSTSLVFDSRAYLLCLLYVIHCRVKETDCTSMKLSNSS